MVDYNSVKEGDVLARSGRYPFEPWQVTAVACIKHPLSNSSDPRRHDGCLVSLRNSAGMQLALVGGQLRAERWIRANPTPELTKLLAPASASLT